MEPKPFIKILPTLHLFDRDFDPEMGVQFPVQERSSKEFYHVRLDNLIGIEEHYYYQNSTYDVLH